MSIKSYKELTVWKKSFELSLIVYRITKNFPKEEMYGIVSQMRRCAISIPSNIAEGYCRQRKLEYIQFLQIAFASGAELETQLLIAKSLGYVSEQNFSKASALLEEVMKMLNSLISKVKASV